MPTAMFYLRPLPSVEALDLFAQAAKALFEPFGFGNSNLVVNTNIVENHYQLPINPPESRENNSEWKRSRSELAGAEGTLRVSSILYRAQTPSRHAFLLTYLLDDGALVATIAVECGDQDLLRSSGTKWATALGEIYRFMPRAQLVEQSLPFELKDRLKYYEVALQDLQAATATIATVGTEQVKQQVEFLQKKSSELDSEHRERLAVLEAAYQQKLAEIAEERRALAEERAAIDMRRNMIARRANEKDLSKLLADPFSVTSTTEKRRRLIHVICGLVLALSCLLVASGAYTLLTETIPLWHHSSALLAGSLLFGSTLIFYLRWNNAWFQRLADEEYANRKLQVDTTRAKWLAEMLLEWSGENKDRTMPTELITAFCSDLFTPNKSTGIDYHPADQLYKLLDGIRHVKIDQNGIELSRKK